MSFDQLDNIGMGFEDAVCYNDRANALAEAGRYREALADYTQAIELHPGYARAYSNRGATYREMQRYDEALGDYERAIELDPNYATAYYNRGLAYGALGRYEEAIGDFNQAIQIGLSSPARAYYSRGKTLAHLGQYKEALEDLNRAVDLDPNKGYVYSDRGFVYNRLEQYDNALKDLKRAIRINPHYALAYVNIAVSFRCTGRLRQALPYLRKATQLGDPECAAQANQMLVQAEKMLDRQRAGGLRGFLRRLFGAGGRTKETRAQLRSRDSGGSGLRSLKLPDIPPGLRPLAEELSQYPPEARYALENILAEAIDAGVSSWEELFAFLETRPDLMTSFALTMSFPKGS